MKDQGLVDKEGNNDTFSEMHILFEMILGIPATSAPKKCVQH